MISETSVLNESTDIANLLFMGSAFHAFGPAVVKERSLNLRMCSQLDVPSWTPGGSSL